MLLCIVYLSAFTFFWSASEGFLVLAPTVAKYAITFFVFSVFPAPDSPLWNNTSFVKHMCNNETNMSCTSKTDVVLNCILCSWLSNQVNGFMFYELFANLLYDYTLLMLT